MVVLPALFALVVGVSVSGARAADEPQPVTAGGILAAPPKDAIFLFSGKAEDITKNWLKRYTTDPAGWTVDADGVASNDKHDIESRQSFGDCYLHAEFRCPVDAAGNAVTDGNSGVGFEGRYEVQILNSYGKKPGPTECGAFYNEKPPRVIASKKAGEWQTYDIRFQAPRFDADGKVIEPARATVWQNGIQIHDNEAFTGPTGIQYGQYKGEVKTGPLILQGDHNPVQFRNVWIVPLP
jgi:hypothetical protein